MNFGDSVAIVTGGLSGIGLATVLEFLKSGIKNISIFDINKEDGQKIILKLSSEFKQANIIFNHTDVSNEKEVEEAFLKTIEKFKKVDILVNNAGIGGDELRLIDVNLKGKIICSNFFNKYMGKNNGGSGGIIIFISSIDCFNHLLLAPIYNASKNGILSYVQSYGQEYHFTKTGIKYICLCPGPTESSIHGSFQRLFHRNNYWKGLILEPPIYQKSDKVGKAVVYLLNNAENGSIWIIDNGELSIINIPDYRTQLKSVIKINS